MVEQGAEQHGKGRSRDVLVMMDGTQARAHSEVIVKREGSADSLRVRSVNRTVMDMIRMLKSTAWTENWPTKALALQAGPGESGSGLSRLIMVKIPDIELFSEFMPSDLVFQN